MFSFSLVRDCKVLVHILLFLISLPALRKYPRLTPISPSVLPFPPPHPHYIVEPVYPVYFVTCQHCLETTLRSFYLSKRWIFGFDRTFKHCSCNWFLWTKMVSLEGLFFSLKDKLWTKMVDHSKVFFFFL